ncbi:hypothetical protein IBX65_06445 [Candidatus Aerophobetes bacterium]|nr:hypothetical protein [Candidatus Aerophobetes bacterium]
MEKIEYFDYQKVAKEMNVPHTTLKKIEQEVKTEFPNDKMMYELHVLRAIRSKYWQKDVREHRKQTQKFISHGVYEGEREKEEDKCSSL